MIRKLLIFGALVVAALTAGGAYFWYIYFAVHTTKYDPQLTIYWGGMTGNSVVLVSEDGSKALVIDTKAKDDAKYLRKNVTAKDVVIVNTHSHFDHTMGNSLYPEATIIGGAYSKEQWASASAGSRYPDQTIAPKAEKTIRIGSEKVHIYNAGMAHTWNDVVVYFENRQLLVSGDLVSNGIHPFLMSQYGTYVGAWITVLETLSGKYRIRTVVPGHGLVSDKRAINEMKDYFVQISDAVNNTNKLEELKKKYASYFSIPNLTGFDKTVDFIKDENN